MLTFKEYLKESNDKKIHYGTCVDSFSSSTGDRKKSKGHVPLMYDAKKDVHHFYERT